VDEQHERIHQGGAQQRGHQLAAADHGQIMAA
jgi:hypothetical protein